MIKDYEFNPYMVSCGSVATQVNPIPGVSLGKRTVRWFELLLFIESNDGHTLIGDRRVPNPPGSLMIRKPGTVMTSMSSFSSYNIAFDTYYDPDLITFYGQNQFERPTIELLEILSKKESPFIKEIPETLVIEDLTRYETLFKDAMQLHLDRPDNYHLQSRRILFDIFDLIHKELEHKQQKERHINNPTLLRLQLSRNWMEENLAKTVSLDDLAKKSGYSREAYCRLFKKHYKVSPINYLIELRINKSKDLLINTDLTLEAIAHLVGIKSHIHFSSTFKTRVGISPGKFRKIHRL